MENLVLKHNKRPIVRGILIIVYVLVLVGLYFIIIRPLDVWDIIELILLTVMYTLLMLYLTAPGGIKITDEGLKIRWFNWLREKSILDSGIEKVILGRRYIQILRKDAKPVRLILEPLEKEGKTKVYEFFIEYSKLRNLELERQLHL